MTRTTPIGTKRSAMRKAVATFVFATTGQLLTVSVFGLSKEAAVAVASVGVGALINFAWRWSEAVLKEDHEAVVG